MFWGILDECSHSKYQHCEYVGNIAGEKHELSSYGNVNEARNHSTLFIRKNPACYDPLDRQTPSLLKIAFEIIR